MSEEAPTKKRTYYVERIPEVGGGVEVSHRNIQEATKALTEWPKSWEVLPFKLCCPVLAVAAAVPGLLINKTLRDSLVLGRTALGSTYFAVTAIPAFVAGSLHYTFVTSKILGQEDKCPVCLQVKGGVVQLITGQVYPMILAPICSFGITSQVKHLYLPKIQKEPRNLLKFVVKSFTPKLRKQLMYLGAFQLILSMGMTYWEQECFFSTITPIMSGEKKIVKNKIELYPDKPGY